MKHFFAILLCSCLSISAAFCEEEPEEQVLEITALDGRVFREATVERLTPSCVDIGYVREDGTYAMIGLQLALLTPEWQKFFSYDPEKAKAFEEQIKAAGRKNMQETAEAEATRMARIAQEIKAKLSGADIQIKPADLRYAVYARRRPVVVIPVEKVRSGTVVAIREDNSNLGELPALILLDGLDLGSEEGQWSGFIFPTGMKARYKDRKDMPVFSDSLDDALVLLERYLDIYSEFAAKEKEKAPAGVENTPPDQAVPAASGGVAGLDNKGFNVPNNSYWSYDSYYLGDNYWPVVWYYRNYPIRYYPQYRPRPPHPHPTRPPQPPQPPKPAPTPRPQLQAPATVERRGNFRRTTTSPAGGSSMRILPPTGPVSGGR